MCKAVSVWTVVLSVLAVCCICANGYAAVATIDGKCNEWKEIKPLSEDPKEDVGAEDVVDWTAFWVIKDDNGLYFSYLCAKSMDWNTNAWRYNIFIDTDTNVKTGYSGYDGNWSVGADHLLQGGTLFKFNAPNQTTWGWEELGPRQYSVEGSQAEVQLPYSAIGMAKGQKINILLHGDNAGKPDFMPDSYTSEMIVIE